MDERTRQNLEDAGCPGAQIDEYSQLTSPEARMQWLRSYRCDLLDGIHGEQRKLDCLDYLIYSLRNEQEE